MRPHPCFCPKQSGLCWRKHLLFDLLSCCISLSSILTDEYQDDDADDDDHDGDDDHADDEDGDGADDDNGNQDEDEENYDSAGAGAW